MLIRATDLETFLRESKSKLNKFFEKNFCRLNIMTQCEPFGSGPQDNMAQIELTIAYVITNLPDTDVRALCKVVDPNDFSKL